MDIVNAIKYSEEEVKIAQDFRERIFHPICDAIDNRCSVCPFSDACGAVEDFLNNIQHKKIHVFEKE